MSCRVMRDSKKTASKENGNAVTVAAGLRQIFESGGERD